MSKKKLRRALAALLAAGSKLSPERPLKEYYIEEVWKEQPGTPVLAYQGLFMAYQFANPRATLIRVKLPPECQDTKLWPKKLIKPFVITLAKERHRVTVLPMDARRARKVARQLAEGRQTTKLKPPSPDFMKGL